MLISSISRGSAAATAHTTAERRMTSYRRARSSAGTSLESQTPRTGRSGWSTTAAATTGPARQPRPTSSTPATYMKPARRSAFSSVRMAGTRVTVYVPGLRCQFCVLRFSFRPPALFHPRRLALEVAQIIQLGAPHLRRPHHLDLLDRRRVERENALDTLAERHLAHRKGPARPAAMHPDDHALEDLDALLVAFAHFHVHADGV